jgi:IclR family transcriptional regulator, KDG regulon repressor
MKTLNKAFDILELFLDQPKELSLEELAKLSRLNKTTVCRIALTMVRRGYLKQPKKRGKYSLGTKYLDFSGVLKNGMGIRDVALPFLEELSRELQESVILVLWDGREAILHEIFHARHALKVAPDEGTRMPLHSTASGKIILAYLKDEELQKIFKGKKLEISTEKTIANIKELKKQLNGIRREGIAFDDEEFSLGVRGVSAELRDSQGAIVGAIGVIGPSVRLTRDKMRETVPVIKNYALKISKALGYRSQ